MSQTNIQDPEKGNITGLSSATRLCPSLTVIVDGQSNQHPSAPFQPPHEKVDANVGDSSGTVFTLYSNIVEDDDNKMAERWQKDADGIIIFVRPELTFCTVAYSFKSCRI
jgi:hypothetical protein